MNHSSNEIWKIIKETQKNIREISAQYRREKKERKKERAEAKKERAEEERKAKAKAKKERAEEERKAKAKAEKERAKAKKERAKAEKERAKAEKERAKAKKERAKAKKERAEEEKKAKESTRKMEASIEDLSKMVKTHMGNDGNRWGNLGENLVKGNLARRLKERGFKVNRVMTRIKREDTEFDIVAIDGKDVVVVEVKATLDPSDVREFEQNIKNFKKYWPEFEKKTIYGAVAFLIKVNRQADILARSRGFLVIEAVGDVFIQNHKKFKPKVFS